MKTVCIVHYNTPELTTAAIRSLQKHTPNCRVVIFDNSDAHPFSPVCGCITATDCITATEQHVIDNTHGQIVEWEQWLQQFPGRTKCPANINKSNYGSAKHCYSVQWMIDHTDEPFVLMDSDVLISRDISPLWDDAFAWVGKIGCNTRRRFGCEILKVEPYLCFINVPMMKDNGVYYFNPDRMWGIAGIMPHNIYDTGAWFLEDCRNHALPYREIDISQYCIHLGHGSWKNKNAEAWLEEHKGLWHG